VKRIRSRVAVLNGLLLLLVGMAWFYAAPAQIGGLTTYVVTHGVSMEPRFHSDDLALVRPVGQYKVGDIVAYHSTLLHEVVLHRIVAIHDGHYTFKGDNNHFLDPVRPTRSELIGKLWIHVPHGGALLGWLHKPAVDAVVCGLLGLFLLYNVGEREQRRRRRRRQGTSRSPSHGLPLVNTPREQDAPRVINFGALLIASAIAVAVFAVLALFTFITPAQRSVKRSTPYSQQVSFAYSARVPAGPVYPSGRITTNDPLFLSIVHHLAIRIAYRFTAAAPAAIAGTEEVLLKLMGPNGWSRSFVLAPRTHFTGEQTSTEVRLNLLQLESLMAEIERLTATPGFGSFSFSVQPIVHMRGILANQPIRANYEPTLGFQIQTDQLVPSSGSAPAGSTPGTPPTSGQANYKPTQIGSVTSPATGPNSVTVFGLSLEVSPLRWVSLVGLLLSSAAAFLCYLRKRGEPFEESVRIRSQYGHLIVPIVGGEDLGWPPVDVRSIKALVRLAESGQRLILHSRAGDVDTYMVNDEGTVYRYQVRPSNVVWGDWSDGAVPVKAAA
jgi:signal peptidase I